MKGLNLIFVFFMIFLLSLTCVSAMDYNNESGTVLTSLNDNNVYGEIYGVGSTGTFDDLQSEIDNAPEGSVLYLTRDYNGASDSRIQLNKDLTIDGQGYVLDCLHETGCSAFYSNSGNIVLKNLTIKNGNHGEGGAIHIEGSAQYTIENCVFKNNRADDKGGAIYNGAETPLRIINCDFINNNVKDSRYASGGAIYAHGDLHVENSYFGENIASYRGGALYKEGTGILRVVKCIFANNEIENNLDLILCGGAIFVYEGDSYIKDSSFHDNIVTNDEYIFSTCGGAISVYDGDLYIEDSSFHDNIVNDDGGAICGIENASLRIINSDFVANRAINGSAGAISYCDIKVTNTSFSDNSALFFGGAICCDNAEISTCIFESNKATGGGASSVQCEGGAIRCKDDLTVDNCTFNKNYAYDYGGAISADTLALKGYSFFDSNTAYDNQGGAIWVNKFRENVKYASFTNNKAGEGAEDDGGAIYIDNENDIMFSQCVFINNHCGDEGGVIYLDSSSSDLILKNNYFLGNTANKEGQAVFNCGVYDLISDNWWGDNLPSEDNDLLVEWKAVTSNVHHEDSNPVFLKLSLNQSICKVNQSVHAQAGFYHGDGSSCDGEMFTELISFLPNENINFINRQDFESVVSMFLIPENEGLYSVTANLFGQFSSADLKVNNEIYGHSNNNYNQKPSFNYIYGAGNMVNNLLVGNIISNQFDDNSSIGDNNNQSIGDSPVKSINNSNDSNLLYLALVLVLIGLGGIVVWRKMKN